MANDNANAPTPAQLERVILQLWREAATTDDRVLSDRLVEASHSLRRESVRAGSGRTIG